MGKYQKTFRIFVSSTFSDLVAERNALQEHVFPRLRELSQQHGVRFQVIDLRWGVSEEASLDQQAMSICLGEIERCQQTSPRPNFIILLGDRYGWCPPPPKIPAGEFDQIVKVIRNLEDIALLKDWYELDNNAVPAEWCLKARQRGGPYENYDNWQPVESSLYTILANAATILNFKDEQRLPYTASATEQEIAAGALSVKEAPEHVVCFLRSIVDLPKSFNAQAFQADLLARVQQEYGWGALAQTSQESLQAILQMAPISSARDFADRMNKSQEQTRKATAEYDFLSFLRQALVDFTARDFINLDAMEWTADLTAHDHQNKLKGRLMDYVPGNVYTYQAQWTGSGITTDHIDQLCTDVYTSLARIILAEIEHPHEFTRTESAAARIRLDEALDDEGRAHLQFAEDRLRFFVGRRTMLEKIDSHLKDRQHVTLAITGAGGTGKSALIARAILQSQESYPKAEIVYRFIGVTPGSSDGRSLLDSLCREISRRYGADQANIPIDYRDLVPELGKRMRLASEHQPLILFLDSLDQLSSSQNARNLVWLPDELPEHVSVIASTRPEDTRNALLGKRAREEVLTGLSSAEGEDLLAQWLASVKRTLQTTQQNVVQEQFNRSEGNPLYLRLAFEEARLWRSDQALEQLAAGVSGIIERNMLDRLTKESNHGEVLVSKALGYLAASRFGLAEDELVDLLSRDIQVYRWFLEGSHHLPADLIEWAIYYLRLHPTQTANLGGDLRQDNQRVALDWLKEIRTPPEKLVGFLSEVLPKADGPRLPIVLWSRLSFDLAPYLTERMVDGSPLMAFYHRELGDVSAKVFLERKAQSYHARLANYFQYKADPKADRSWSGGDRHGLSELPYHLIEAALYDDVNQTLTDFKFLEHKAAEVGVLERKDEKGNVVKTYGGVLQLQEDYELALRRMPGEAGGSPASWGDRPPLIITARETGAGLTVYCPICNKTSPVRKEVLDTVITCPQPGCGTRLKLNPFVIKARM